MGKGNCYLITIKCICWDFQDKLHHTAPASVCVHIAWTEAVLQFYILRDLGVWNLKDSTKRPPVPVAIIASCTTGKFSRTSTMSNRCRIFRAQFSVIKRSTFLALLDSVRKAYSMGLFSVVRRPSVVRLWHRLTLKLLHGFLSDFSCGFPWTICPDFFSVFNLKKNFFFTNIFRFR